VRVIIIKVFEEAFYTIEKSNCKGRGAPPM
jgi:hypothetical protein